MKQISEAHSEGSADQPATWLSLLWYKAKFSIRNFLVSEKNKDKLFNPNVTVSVIREESLFQVSQSELCKKNPLTWVPPYFVLLKSPVAKSFPSRADELCMRPETFYFIRLELFVSYPVHTSSNVAVMTDGGGGGLSITPPVTKLWNNCGTCQLFLCFHFNQAYKKLAKKVRI